MTEVRDFIGAFSGGIDPHLPPYNAKGGAFLTTEAGTDGSGYIGVPGYQFSSADVGKIVICDLFGGERSISSVSGGKAVIAGGALPANQSDRGFFCGWDDTLAIQTALDDAQYMWGFAGTTLDRGPFVGLPIGNSRNGVYGRTVLLRDTGYYVRNPQSAYDAGKHACLVQRKRTGLRGLGRDQTRIFSDPGHVGYGLMNDGGDGQGDQSGTLPTVAYTDGMLLADLTFDGLAGFAANALALDNIYWQVSFNGYSDVDPRNEVRNVGSRSANRDSFFMSGRGDLLIGDCHGILPKRHAFHFKRLNDSIFSRSFAAGARSAGVKVDSCQDLRLIGVKSYYSGIAGGTDPGPSANFWLTADQPKNGLCSLDACRAQESRGSSIYIESGYNTLTGFQAQDPSRAGQLTDTGTLPTVQAGVHLGPNALDNEINMNIIPCVSMFNDQQNPAKPVYKGTHAVFLDGGATKTKGEVNTVSVMDGTYTAAKVGGAGATNGTNTRLRVDEIPLT